MPLPNIAAMAFGASPRLTDRTLVSTVPNTENALCAINFTPDGRLQTTEGAGGGVTTTRLPEWWGQHYSNFADIAEGFQIRLDVSGGTVAPNTGASAPVATWIDMNGASVLWELFRTTAGSITGIWDVQIRNRATTQQLTVARYTVTCTKS